MGAVQDGRETRTVYNVPLLVVLQGIQNSKGESHHDNRYCCNFRRYLRGFASESWQEANAETRAEDRHQDVAVHQRIAEGRELSHVP